MGWLINQALTWFTPPIRKAFGLGGQRHSHGRSRKAASVEENVYHSLKLPACSCISITLRRNWTALYGAVAAQVHLHSLCKRSTFARRNSRNTCIRNCKCMLLRSLQALLRIFRRFFSALAPFLSFPRHAAPANAAIEGEPATATQ